MGSTHRTAATFLRWFSPALLLLATSVAALDSASEIAPFSTAPLGAAPIPGWTPTFIPSVKQHTRFSIVEEDQRQALRIDAKASAGTLIHRIAVDPKQRPWLRWQWKIPKHNAKTNLHKKAGDDFPARLYVIFDYDLAKLRFLDRIKLKIARNLYGNDVPGAALCYVWDPTLPAGTSAWNAYTNRLRMIVVRSADDGRWRSQERNVYQDFKSAFGEEPPMISAIAVAGDSDNTGEATLSFIGDTTLSAQ